MDTSSYQNKKFYAHSREGKSPKHWHDLKEHLEGTAMRAAQFAESFGSVDWAYLAGVWHDLGKYSEEFQAYLLRENGFEAHIENVSGRVDHSTAGAKHAVNQFPILGHLLAYPIAGHHSGLHDGRSDGACLDNRLHNRSEIPAAAPNEILQKSLPELPDFLKQAFAQRDGFAISFFIRMLFSSLVDSDFLDTEHFFSPEQTRLRACYPEGLLSRMESSLNEHMNQFDPDGAPVNKERAAVRRDCLERAVSAPGFFSLTVPTGGGKTLASLAFALRHAQTHGMSRIIYVVPFTSIIEQNAQEFRKAMAGLNEIDAESVVIEHHSNFDPDKETPYSRLACENWDAPLIVTTSVQFYESLFANRTSACRKLHNLSKAVIVIDEAQTIPVDYLKPCLKALKELVFNYGATVVLCTATQPVIHRRADFEIGIDHVREIISDPPALYNLLKRVEIKTLGPMSDVAVFDLLKGEPQVLCVVNTVKHAQKLSEMMGEDEGHFHLTAAKCPAHRSKTLSVIRKRLEQGRPCRVISTQLIEAGVDVDFPAVYRSMAGLDSIAQSAGRCNRHGKMQSLGRVYVFQSEHAVSERFISDTVNCASQMLEMYPNNLLALDAIEHYFKMYYWDQTDRWDSRKILDSFQLVQNKDFPFLFDFAKVARNFQIIQQAGRPVIIPWGDEGRELCKKLEALPSLNRDICRYLQRYTVQVRERVWVERIDRGIKKMFDGSLAVLTSPELYYSDGYGLRFQDPEGQAFFA